MEERQHLLRGELFSRTDKETEWRFCRAQIVRVWTPTFSAANISDRQHFRPPTSFVGRQHFNSCLVTVVYYETRTSSTGRRYFMWAQIFQGREYFRGANISGAQIFHGREYFMGANISWTLTFHGREYFMGANISWARIFCV